MDSIPDTGLYSDIITDPSVYDPTLSSQPQMAAGATSTTPAPADAADLNDVVWSDAENSYILPHPPANLSDPNFTYSAADKVWLYTPSTDLSGFPAFVGGKVSSAISGYFGNPFLGKHSLIMDTIELVKTLGVEVGNLVQIAEDAHPLNWFKQLAPLLPIAKDIWDLPTTLADLSETPIPGGDVQIAKNVAGATWQFIADHTIGLLYQGMLVGGLEVDVTEFDDNAMRGVRTVDTMLGFTLLMQFASAAMDMFGEGLFAGRWGKAIALIVKEIPEELGLTWAMGMSIDEAFKVAVGRSIEEGINKQKRGNRIGWPQLRTLLKQHVLLEDEFQELMENQGFPDHQIDMLKRLQDVQIPIGDIAQLWYRDEIDDAEAKKLISELGFGEKQVDWLYNLYVSKAENSASVTYRTIVRGMFVNHLVTEDMYRTVLQNANYPQKLIDEDVAGILLEQSVGHVLNAATTIKTRYQHGAIDAQEARKELRELNYADTYITQLIQTWDMKPLVKSHGLSQAKILSYYVSGTLTRSQAEPQLLATGLDEPSTTFLLDHPTANGGVRMHQRTPGLVTQTYLDGALTLDQLPDAYRSAHVQDADIPWYVNNAKYRYAHMKGHSVPTKVLSDGDIRAAFKAGLIDFPHCVSMLEVNGWSSDDAMLLTEITNKGPYQAPGQPAFATLVDALLYLQQHGFNLTPPPDPMLLAAETMAGMAGWTWTVNPGAAPVGSLPPPPITPPVIVPPPLPGQ